MSGHSALVSNMRVEADEMGTFPVLIGDEIAHFHDVNGHFDTEQKTHVVEFIHRVQGPGSPYHISPSQASHKVEAHFDNYYSLNVNTIKSNIDEYPDNDYVFRVSVENYMSGEHSFSKAMRKDIDKRETRFE